MPMYRICGLTVAAEMGLPGAVPCAVPPGREDVQIRSAAVPEHLDAADACGPVWEATPRRLLLRLPSVGRFLAEDGRRLDVEPAKGGDLADTLPFLLGTGFGALLYQRGGMVLHASTVAIDGRAYAFCGRSGAGKSTLAAALCLAGAQFVGDDMASVVQDVEGRPMVWPDGRRLKLFADGIAHFSLEDRRGEAVRPRIAKHFVDLRAPVAETPVPLAGIYLLQDLRPPMSAAITRLSALDSAQALLHASYRPRLLLAMSLAAGHVAQTAAMLHRVPVFQLTRPRELECLPETVERLMAHWLRMEG